jgi:hypothetical protein
MRQVIARVGAWKLGLRALENLKTGKDWPVREPARSAFLPDGEAGHPGSHAQWDTWPRFRTVCAAVASPHEVIHAEIVAQERIAALQSNLRQVHPHFEYAPQRLTQTRPVWPVDRR